MNVYVNDSYIPFLEDETRTQIFYGGSSSGKSFFLAQRTIIDVLRGHNYLVIRNVAGTIRSSVFNQIYKAILDFGLQNEFVIASSTFSITCKRNKKQILFAGLDDVEKLKSITPISGVLTDVWIEEATETNYEAYKQLTKRLRGETKESIRKRIIFSFNPVMQTHWIYKEFFGGWDDSKNIYRDDDLVILKTTYKDNSFLTEDDKKGLENEKDKYFYEVYTLGNWGVLGKIIFKNWHTEDLSSQIPHFDKIYNGLDFGFSEDPNALIRAHVDSAQKKIYIFDEMYKAGMLNDELSESVAQHVPKEQYITCDCASSQSIAELNSRGIKAIPATKGPNSVNFGIQWLQGYEIIVDVRCQNFKNEIQVYHWEEDKYGNTLRKPVDRDNHLIDALRYATEPLQLGIRAEAVGRM